DDITKHTLCEFFGSNLIVNEKVLTMVKTIFQQLNRPMPDVNLKQAEVPDNCIVLKNNFGTAPGMWFEQDEKIIVSMPGVPFEMKPMLTDEVLPMLEQKFR